MHQGVPGQVCVRPRICGSGFTDIIFPCSESNSLMHSATSLCVLQVPLDLPWSWVLPRVKAFKWSWGTLARGSRAVCQAVRWLRPAKAGPWQPRPLLPEDAAGVSLGYCPGESQVRSPRKRPPALWKVTGLWAGVLKRCPGQQARWLSPRKPHLSVSEERLPPAAGP